MVKFMKYISFYLGIMLFFFSLMFGACGVSYYFSGLVTFLEWEIYSFNSSSMILIFLFDWMSLMFMSFVLIISSMVLIYSTFYMWGDPYFVRFIILVFLFVLSMVFMILIPNLISILLGWDGLGLVSYCLVIYYQNVKSANSGMITILSNRVGDIAILLSISWLLNFGSWNFYYFQFIFKYEDVFFVLFLVILAAMTKSAQIPFSAWLPAAMAAPTPVSSLVHSSTLVTAGVYLLIRFNYIIGENLFLFYLGVMTMFMSGLGANYENDLKKIIALSTLSQLGLMMMTLGLGFFEYSFFHLITHAMFKSLLFLCAGVYIHSFNDTQDIRYLGGMLFSFPLTSLYFIVSSLALCGFPFLSGYYSKDLILEMYMMGDLSLFFFGFVILATVFTLTYSIRLIYFMFLKNLGSMLMYNIKEEGGMFIPMFLLFSLSMFGGSGLSLSIFPVIYIYLPFMFKFMVLFILVIIFFLMNYYFSNFTLYILDFSRFFSNFLGLMWGMHYLFTLVLMPLFKFGKLIINNLDQGWLEYMGGQGLIFSVSSVSSFSDIYNFINMKFYVFFYFFSFALIFIFMII